MADTQTLTPDAVIRTNWQLFINGQQVDAASGETFDVINPATNEKLATVAKAGKADVDAAVQAAREAFDKGKWVRMGRPAARQLCTRWRASCGRASRRSPGWKC